MAGSYDAARAMAARVLKRRGVPLALTRPLGSAFNPVTEAETTSTRAWSLLGVGLPPTQAQRLGVNLEGRQAVEFTFAAGPTPDDAPRPRDKVTKGGVAYTLFWAQTFDPDGAGAILTIAYGEQGG